MTGGPARFRIALADERRGALETLARRLRALGHDVTALALTVTEAVERVAEHDPELAIVVLHEDDEHALGLVAELARTLDGPVVVLVDPPDAAFLAAAADHGISAFATSEDDEELQGSIEVAERLHRQRSALEAQVGALSTALERRGVIEQAKGVLMERHHVTEPEATARLEAGARAAGRRITDVAADVVRRPGG